MFSHVRIQIHDYPTAPAANARSVNSAYDSESTTTTSTFWHIGLELSFCHAWCRIYRCGVRTSVYKRDREIPTSLLSLIG